MIRIPKIYRNYLRLFLAAIAVIIICIAAIRIYSGPKKNIDVRKGTVNKIETMVHLCAVDLYSEVPVLDTINNKVMFAIQKQRGSVSFGLENMAIDTEGDTVKVTLSPEIVEIYEATDDNSWEVIDSKGLGLFTSDKFTLEEENALKANIRKNSVKRLYHNGTIARARAEGAKNLKSLMEKVHHKPVVVTDPTPNGAYYEENK